jgi:hypothetical protein
MVAESISNWREAAPENPGCDYKKGRGKPNPKEFALKNFETTMAEKSPETNRRDANRSPGEKIAVIVERGEEGNSQAAIRHGVQETVARSRQEEVNPEREPGKVRQSSPEPYKHYRAR